MKRLFPITLIAIAVVLGYLFLSADKANTPPDSPEQFAYNRENFSQARQLFNEAMDLTIPPGSSGRPFDVSKEHESEIRAKLVEGIELSKKIDDSFLEYLRPGLSDYYHNKYVKGHELILDGLNSDTSNANSIGVQKQLEGSNLIDEFNTWWNTNSGIIHIEM